MNPSSRCEIRRILSMVGVVRAAGWDVTIENVSSTTCRSFRPSHQAALSVPGLPLLIHGLALPVTPCILEETLGGSACRSSYIRSPHWHIVSNRVARRRSVSSCFDIYVIKVSRGASRRVLYLLTDHRLERFSFAHWFPP